MADDVSKMNDHDLLITMHEQIKNLRADIAEIKSGTKVQLEDHESRIRGLEKASQILSGKNIVIGAVVTLLLGVLGGFLTHLM